jgi:hypothetical protein
VQSKANLLEIDGAMFAICSALVAAGHKQEDANQRNRQQARDNPARSAPAAARRRRVATLGNLAGIGFHDGLPRKESESTVSGPLR